MSGSALYLPTAAPGCRAKATGHRGRASPPPPPRQPAGSCGAGPSSSSPMPGGGGGCAYGGRCDSLSLQCRSPGLPVGRSCSCPDLPDGHLGHGADPPVARGPWLPLDPVGEGAALEPRANECVYKHLLGDGGQGSAQLPVDFQRSETRKFLSFWSAYTEQTPPPRGAQTPLSWKWPGTQAGGGVVRHGVCPHALWPA